MVFIHEYSRFRRYFLEFFNKKGYYITMMEEKSTKAFGAYYFENPALPIAVAEVRASSETQHAHDLTAQEHSHDFSELVLITAGNGPQFIDGTECTVSAGDVFLIRGHTSHCFPDRRRVSMLNVQFDPERLALPGDFLRQIPGYNVIFQLEPAMRGGRSSENRLRLDRDALALAEEQIRQLHAELERREPGYEAAALALLLELIVFVSRRYGNSQAPNQAALLRMGEVISRIERDYASPLTLKRLAAVACTSPNNLLRLFRTATGNTPIEYLLEVRLRRAAELLRRTELPVGEVAARCGFHDSNYFSKRFRMLYGTSPRSYRGRLE